MPKIKLGTDNESYRKKYYDAQNIYEDDDYNLKNKSFIQYYDKSYKYRCALQESDPIAFRVFDLLARHCENNNTIITSRKEIAEVLNKSESTIKRAIKKLREINFLTLIRDGQHDYVYFLNPQIVFNAKAEYKKKMQETYQQYAGSSEINFEIEEKTLNEDALEKFAKREKKIFKFKLKNRNMQEPSINELINTQKAFEEIERQKQKENDPPEEENGSFVEPPETTLNDPPENFEFAEDFF